LGAIVSLGWGREGFFFVKKKQKTFRPWGTGGFKGTGPNEQSFFCFFFVHKKEELPLSFVLVILIS
jgi:hypothetical protein